MPPATMAPASQESHEHEHEHDDLEHARAHVHDEHHRHEHGPDGPPGEPHMHAHRTPHPPSPTLAKSLQATLIVGRFGQQPIPKRDNLWFVRRQFRVDDPIRALDRERHIDWHRETAVQQVPCRKRRAGKRNSLPSMAASMSMLA
jgi:hypothetical protein